MKDINKKVVLVTGASSGIGKAIAHAFVRRGYTAYGTTRKLTSDQVESIDGLFMIGLDVNDEQGAQAALATIHSREGRLDVLINNAGFGIAGALEDTAPDEASAQFETNFFGTLRMCRLALPLLRETQGIIINISSVAGILSIPFQGLYSASKAAMESMTEALRMEIRSFGVRVCLVEPGDTATGFTASRQYGRQTSPLYQKRLQASLARMEQDEQNGTSPEKVAEVVCKLAEHKNPPVRRAVGAQYRFFLWLQRFMPHRLKLWVLGKLYA